MCSDFHYLLVRGGFTLGEIYLEFVLHKRRFELDYHVMRGTKYFVTLHTNVVLT